MIQTQSTRGIIRSQSHTQAAHITVEPAVRRIMVIVGCRSTVWPLYSRISVALGLITVLRHTVTVVEDDPHCLQQKCSPKNLVFVFRQWFMPYGDILRDNWKRYRVNQMYPHRKAEILYDYCAITWKRWEVGCQCQCQCRYEVYIAPLLKEHGCITWSTEYKGCMLIAYNSLKV